MPADDIRMCEWADSRNHAGEEPQPGENYEETGMGLVNYSGAGGGARALSCDRTGLCDRSGWDPA